MALDTAQKRYSAMNPWAPWRQLSVLPTGTIDQGMRQAAALAYSGILAGGGVVIGIIGDLNTRLRVYLAEFYGVSQRSDLTMLVDRYLDTHLTGDYTKRMKQLIKDATDAMS